MSWRTLLGLVLLLAAVITGWSAWRMRDRSAPEADSSRRSDYVLRDFELVALDKDGVESIRLRAPKMQRSRKDESLGISKPVFLIPGEAGPWTLTADRGWVSPDGSVMKLKGNVAGDSATDSPVPTTLRTDALELRPEKNQARTSERVTLTRPGIMQTGVGFRANLKTRQYQFLSQVQTRYEPTARQ